MIPPRLRCRPLARRDLREARPMRQTSLPLTVAFAVDLWLLSTASRQHILIMASACLLCFVRPSLNLAIKNFSSVKTLFLLRFKSMQTWMDSCEVPKGGLLSHRIPAGAALLPGRPHEAVPKCVSARMLTVMLPWKGLVQGARHMSSQDDSAWQPMAAARPGRSNPAIQR